MGTMGADVGAPQAPLQATERFEAPEIPDTDWARTVAQREAAEGLPVVRSPAPISFIASHSEVNRALDQMEQRRQSLGADLTGLPDRFTLEIERKADRWKVTAPGVHSGLWKSGTDLPAVVDEALAVLAEMVRVDGVAPRPRVRKK